MTRRDDGFVLVTIMVVMAFAMVIAGVALSETGAHRQTATDAYRAARAQHAADAGLQSTLYRLNQASLRRIDFNRGVAGVSVGLACLLNQVDLNLVGVVTAATHCPDGRAVPPVETGEPEPVPLGNRTSYVSYVVAGISGPPSSGHVALRPRIVSVGIEHNGTATTSDDVVRRVQAIVAPVDPFQAVEATGDLTFRGAATVFNGNARANGDFVLEGLALTGGNVNLGSATVNTAGFEYGGTYRHPVLVLAVPAPVRRTPAPFFERAPVSVSPAKPDCGGPPPSGPCPSASFYDAATHRLTVPAGASLTLASGDYVFCSVSVAGDPDGPLLPGSAGTLRTSATGEPVRIFVDDPGSNRCAGTSATGGFTADGRLNPGATLAPTQLQVYLAGNGTPGATAVRLGGATTAVTTALFLYAPASDVTVRYTAIHGTIVGRDVVLQADAAALGLGVAGVITQDLDLADEPLVGDVGVFRQLQYVECRPRRVTAATATTEC